MCGFLGEITNKLLEQKAFKNLLDLSKQRGPDQQAIWQDDVCQLGFNRLAILDITEAGKQPVVSPSGRYVMVLNGEIYNFKDLQLEYEIPDSELRSSSDVEIVSHLLDKILIGEISKKLNGMFAIAIWDKQTHKLYLIRDFAGIKPLYYGFKDEQIVFASQFDQVFKHPLFKEKELRANAMKTFFGFGYMHAPDTVFESIYQIEPGQIVVWDFISKSISEKTLFYNWEVSEVLLDSAITTKVRFKDCLQESIKRQLQSDVPIATFLSSGVDSSIITALAKKERNDLTAFTFGLASQGKYDERDDAKNYASFLKVNHVVGTANEEDLLSQIDLHFKAMPEPFGDYSSIPTYMITQKAKKYATVMLGGDGGDELFWGYPRFRKSVNQAHWFKYPLWCRKLVIPILRKKYPQLSYAIERLRKFDSWIMEKQMYFSGLDALMPDVKLTDAILKTYSFNEKPNKSSVLQFLKQNEFHGHMQRTLKKMDLCSMAHSLEVRVPFLDKSMIAFSNSIKSEFTITHNIAKLVPKKALHDLIPLDILNSEKKGFSVPLDRWLKNELKEDYIETVLETPFYGAEKICLRSLKDLVTKYFNDSEKVDKWGLWHLYAWQKWAIHHDLIGKND